MFFLLAACASASDSPAPSDWFYADQGHTIDWSSVHFDGPDVVFHTVGDGLLSGPVYAPWVGSLTCGTPTRLTLAFEDDLLADITSVPYDPCVESIAARMDWGSLDLDGLPLYSVRRALVVLDVPGEEGAWSSS
jgi:hypothetical protein